MTYPPSGVDWSKVEQYAWSIARRNFEETQAYGHDDLVAVGLAAAASRLPGHEERVAERKRKGLPVAAFPSYVYRHMHGAMVKVVKRHRKQVDAFPFETAEHRDGSDFDFTRVEIEAGLDRDCTPRQAEIVRLVMAGNTILDSARVMGIGSDSARELLQRAVYNLGLTDEPPRETHPPLPAPTWIPVERTRELPPSTRKPPS